MKIEFKAELTNANAPKNKRFGFAALDASSLEIRKRLTTSRKISNK
jgi:hypothetical protein